MNQPHPNRFLSAYIMLCLFVRYMHTLWTQLSTPLYCSSLSVYTCSHYVMHSVHRASILSQSNITSSGYNKENGLPSRPPISESQLYIFFLISSRFHKPLPNCLGPLVQRLWSNMRHNHCASGLLQLRKISRNRLLIFFMKVSKTIETRVNIPL